MTFEVVRVLVAPAISLFGHEPGRSVAKVQRNRIDASLGKVVLQLA